MSFMRPDELKYFNKAREMEEIGSLKIALEMYGRLIKRKVQNKYPYERYRIISKKLKDTDGVIYAMESYINMLAFSYHPKHGDKKELLEDAQRKLKEYIEKNVPEYKSDFLNLTVKPETEQAIIEISIQNNVGEYTRKYPQLKSWSLESLKFLGEAGSLFSDYIAIGLSEGKNEQEIITDIYTLMPKTRRNSKGEIVPFFPNRNDYFDLMLPGTQKTTEEDLMNAVTKSKETYADIVESDKKRNDVLAEKKGNKKRPQKTGCGIILLKVVVGVCVGIILLIMLGYFASNYLGE